jgi:hypothetical protein
MSGEKLDYAKLGAKTVVDLLEPVDKLAIVAFGSYVDIKFPLTYVGKGSLMRKKKKKCFFLYFVFTNFFFYFFFFFLF